MFDLLPLGIKPRKTAATVIQWLSERIQK